MNSSRAPLGPRTRNSLMIIWPAVATAASPPGLPVGRILNPPAERDTDTVPLPTAGTAGTLISPTSGAAGAAGAGAGCDTLTTLWGDRTIGRRGNTRAFFFFFFLFF